MKKPKNQKVYYYRNPESDDFAGTNIHTRKVDEHFPYVIENPLWKTAAFCFYQFIARPLVWIYCALIYRVRYVNHRAVRRIPRKTGYFLYGNHTQTIDVFTSNCISYPRQNHIIAGPDAVSIKAKWIVLMLGAIPIPGTVQGMKKFQQTIEYRIRQGRSVTIFPEAHIWPFCTMIRPFSAVSFKFPVKLNVPVVAAVTTYQKSPLLSLPRATVFVSEPMYPNPDLSPKQAAEDLRNRVYDFMCEKAERYNTYEYIRYEKADDLPQEEASSVSDAEETQGKLAT